jgi:hypothetical protein
MVFLDFPSHEDKPMSRERLIKNIKKKVRVFDRSGDPGRKTLKYFFTATEGSNLHLGKCTEMFYDHQIVEVAHLLNGPEEFFVLISEVNEAMSL